jgi:Mg2+ and Co2+ transporter CorA
MNLSHVFLLTLSVIYTCHGNTECEDRRVDVLLEEMASLRRSVLALEDTVQRQRDLIDDLNQRHKQQEGPIEEIPIVKDTQTRLYENLEHRLEIIETRLKAEHAPFSGSNVTTNLNGNRVTPNKEKGIRRSKSICDIYTK